MADWYAKIMNADNLKNMIKTAKRNYKDIEFALLASNKAGFMYDC